MEGIMALLIPILGVIFAVGLPLSIPIIVLVLRYRQRKRAVELLHAERMAAIERGMEIPPLPLEVESPKAPQTGLLRGLVCAGVGISLIGSWFFMKEEGVLLAGLIVGAIGLAYLIYYGVEGRKLAHSTPAHVMSPSSRPEDAR